MPQQKITQFTVLKRKSEERKSPPAKAAKLDGAKSPKAKASPTKSPKKSPTKSAKSSPAKSAAAGSSKSPAKSPKAARKSTNKSPEKTQEEPSTSSAIVASPVPVSTVSNSAVLLTPEQKKTIEQNRCSAKMKQLTNRFGNLIAGLDSSWFSVLEAEFSKPYFEKLAAFVNEQRATHVNKVFPPENDVLSWSRHTPFSNVRVVLLGQDPYHGPRQAHGLCFSVLRPVPPPPSLVNMFKELETDIPGFKRPSHGDLTGWADQGVLLLNAVLTVRQAEPNSHKDRGWEQFTDAVIRAVNDKCRNVVFILWGGYAQKKGRIVDKQRHFVLQGAHPSPLSAHNGFFGCRHFSKTNEYLKQHGFPLIDWTKLP